MAIDPKQVQAAFLEVVQAVPAERSAILDRVCGDDAELRQRVEVLLRAHDDSGELPPVAGEGTGPYERSAALVGHDLQPGKMFAGRYKLREKLGEGGMGIVWVADQTEPVQRRVALKVIKSADDSRRLLARFEQERQALALMDHPNIAKVFDAGVSAEGRPYFVMELIKGVPLTKYCDEAKLTPRQRLELFGPVCQAVQHAHQKGIIHRDLKPNNILIGLYDGRPVPKVIDFGVAKAIGRHLTEESIYTEVGAMIGTLEYMSPEQAELNNLDIDTRSDIYALGVILYELLTGGVPFSRQEMKAAGFAEMLRIIKEVEPPKPSTRISGSGTLPTVAALRHTEPAKLARLVRGELDWIVMKCLEKDRSRRYETANGLALDLQRYLADEPVAAGPPSIGYRLRKFIRRNKTQVIAAAFVTMALLAGMAGTTLGLLEARSQRDGAELARQAEANRAEGERVAKDNAETKRVEAEKEKARAEAGEKLADDRLKDVKAEKKKAAEEKHIAQSVRDFLQHKLLGQADVTQQANALLGGGGFAAEAKENPTIRELLDRAAKELTADKIDANFPNQPLVQAEILKTVGDTYCGVGEYERAIGFLQRALALYRQQQGHGHPDTLHSMNNLALAYQDAGKLDLALTLSEETLKLSKSLLGQDHPDTLHSMNNLALAYLYAGKLDLALLLFEDTLKLQKAKLGHDHPDTVNGMSNLACAYLFAGKLDLALPIFEQTLKLRKAKLGPDHPDTLISMNNLASAYHHAGKQDLALPLFEKTLNLRKAKLGHDHPHTLLSMASLAFGYQSAGKLDLALPLFEETVKLMKAKLGPDHPHTLITMGNLAGAYQAGGRQDLALPLLDETLKLMKANLPPEHPNTLTAMANLAGAYMELGKQDLALSLLEETLRLQNAKLGLDHPHTLNSMNSLGAAYRTAGRLDLALPLLKETLKLRTAKLGPDHPDTLNSMSNLAVLYHETGNQDLALPLLEATLKLWKPISPPGHPDSLRAMGSLALAYQRAGQLDQALPLFEERLKVSKVILGLDHPNTLESMMDLAGGYWVAGKLDQALPLYVETLKRRKAKFVPDHPETLKTMDYLTSAYQADGKLDQALSLFEERLKLTEAKLGPNHAETLGLMNNAAVAYWQAKQLDKSIPLFEETLKRREAKFGRDHLDTLNTLANLGVNYKDAGRLKEAIPLLEEAYRAAKKNPSLGFVSIPLLEAYSKAGENVKVATLLPELLSEFRKRLPKNSPQLAGLLAQVAKGLLLQKKGAEAEPLLRECLAIREKTDPQLWTTFNTKSMLGGALLGQKKYADAEPLLLAGYEGMKQREKTIPEQGKIRLTEAVERLVQMYEATGKKDDVAKWRAELAKYPETAPMPRKK